ncbi:uncharacterized protein LODBEIA_P36290 [Lodderomyces beijingensis]|uniref:AB hydrolase-1 domain-containing protein n=1 Tax=Lodderomyces beijingensis TaxID=1775926 RepID=A0ABP0ZT81_9ASCO
MGDPNASNEPKSASSSSSTLASNESASSTASSVNSVPLTKSFQDWWYSSPQLQRETGTAGKSDVKLEQAKLKNRQIEYNLFRAMLPDYIYIKPPTSQEQEDVLDPGNIRGELMDVPIADGSFIHEFYLENTDTAGETTHASSPSQHIVIIHGYMAALGFFIKNVESLVAVPGVKLHIIDLPGFGNSSRSKFPAEFLTRPKELKQRIDQVLQIENWFIDKVEAWRKIRGVDRFKLIGHSMGAYLSCCYLMKYNVGDDGSKLVQDVILVSPMGTESNEHSLINDKKFDFNLHQRGGDPFGELMFEDGDDGKVVVNEEFTKFLNTLGKPKFPKNYILEKLWQNNISPFEILQKFGPFYSKILSYWSFQRFKNFGDSEDSIDLILKLHDYSYSIFNQYQGSGELAITKLINHEILAQLPLCDRGLVSFLAENDINNMWVYGDKDWMNHKGGEYIFKKIRDKNDKITRFEIVENAGHHIYLDNPKAFNSLVEEFFRLK